MTATVDLERYFSAADRASLIAVGGTVEQLNGLTIEGRGPCLPMGSPCLVYPFDPGEEPLPAEVVGFRNGRTALMPLGSPRGIGPGCRIVGGGESNWARVGFGLIGRVVDALGRPFDGRGPLALEDEQPLNPAPINPMDRGRIRQPLDVGVRSLNGLLTIARGQRMGIMAGSGVGKSVLLGMMARHAQADVIVLALVGERGREVREFLERDLGEEGRARSVTVVATGDQPALVRERAAAYATAVAEYFRSQGLSVLLMMDSLTRMAMAHREVGLAAGEPPTTKGYPPSVFGLLSRTLERCGVLEGGGDITGIYTVLVEGDDLMDPIADASRAILDGHVVLSRRLAAQNIYPAIDILESVSRSMLDVVTTDQAQMAARFKTLLAAHADAQDLITVGAYAKGSDSLVDEAISRLGDMHRYIKQGLAESATLEESVSQLASILSRPMR